MEKNEDERTLISHIFRNDSSAEITNQDKMKAKKKHYNKPVIEPIEIDSIFTICATSIVETCNIVQSAGQEVGDDFDFSDNTTFNQTWE